MTTHAEIVAAKLGMNVFVRTVALGCPQCGDLCYASNLCGGYECDHDEK